MGNLVRLRIHPAKIVPSSELKDDKTGTTLARHTVIRLLRSECVDCNWLP